MNIINKSLSFFVGLIYLPLLMADPLPDPLVLEQAMVMADDAQHYQIIEAQAAIVEARSELERAQASLGFRAQLEVKRRLLTHHRLLLISRLMIATFHYD